MQFHQYQMLHGELFLLFDILWRKWLLTQLKRSNLTTTQIDTIVYIPEIGSPVSLILKFSATGRRIIEKSARQKCAGLENSSVAVILMPCACDIIDCFIEKLCLNNAIVCFFCIYIVD